MGKEIRIVLTEQKPISGKIRKPGYILLEGICASKITADDVNKAIQLNQVKVKTVKKDSKQEKVNSGDPSK